MVPTARPADSGTVTAEFAVLLPAVTMLIAVLLVIASCAVTQMRCADAARAGARGAALGEADTVVAELAQRVGGTGIRVGVHRAGEWVRVAVQQEVGPALPVVGAITVAAEATAWVEP
ncbi:TadE family type IV pilus minor pilin [Cellulomonas taurus]|uniref:TadE family type IV pilus minor pilin n=1 Tax=Cellulomonas taurus TaxID=2729175 RepID=UPI00145F94BF|nr:TadE family type IV pilus minor pilin [Cellulomonas taurus]